MRLKNLLGVSGRFFSCNSVAEIRILFFVLKSRPFLFPYIPTYLRTEILYSVRLAEGVHISSNPASHLLWAFHSSSEISRENGVQSVRLRLIFVADSATERTGLRNIDCKEEPQRTTSAQKLWRICTNHLKISLHQNRFWMTRQRWFHHNQNLQTYLKDGRYIYF